MNTLYIIIRILASSNKFPLTSLFDFLPYSLSKELLNKSICSLQILNISIYNLYKSQTLS